MKSNGITTLSCLTLEDAQSIKMMFLHLFCFSNTAVVHLPVISCAQFVFWLGTLLNLMKNPDRFPPMVNSVTRWPRRLVPIGITEVYPSDSECWAFICQRQRFWFSCWGHSCMEKKAGPNQVNWVFLYLNKRIILTLWPHQLWRMSFYSQSVIRKESPTLFKNTAQTPQVFFPSGTAVTLAEQDVSRLACVIWSFRIPMLKLQS